MTLNQTHDMRRQSWVDSANHRDSDFPLQNLPLGVFRTGSDPETAPCVAIGTDILDLSALAREGLLSMPPAADDLPAPRVVWEQPNLNALMASGPAAWSSLRSRLSELLGADTCPPGPTRDRVKSCLVPQTKAEMVLPVRIGDYTDFYASIHHATNVGRMFRPDQPLLPNYKWVPIGYHGRSSSIVTSGTPVRRPAGQIRPGQSDPPSFSPCRQLDYELELGAFVGPGNPQGMPVALADAHKQIFGVVLLNDWSARDIQSWEYQPLGPFLAKNFATTISPWVVTMEALAPFRCAAYSRPVGDPAPLPYLTDSQDAQNGGLNITLEAWLLTARMRQAGETPHRLSSGNLRQLYWTLAQLMTHHTSNGCNLNPGDLLGSGTVSGETPGSRGCLLELTCRGLEPLNLPNGESRGFLEDGDEVILRGYAESPGARRIGLGECRGVVLPARS